MVPLPLWHITGNVVEGFKLYADKSTDTQLSNSFDNDVDWED